MPGFSEPLFVARSTGGGSTWCDTQVTYAAAAAPQRFGNTGCTTRTDSHGTVYVFYMQFTTGLTAYHNVVKSFDGGVHWTRPQRLFAVNDVFYKFDPDEGRYVFDGIAGTREDLGSTPSVSIANGGPQRSRGGQVLGAGDSARRIPDLPGPRSPPPHWHAARPATPYITSVDVGYSFESAASPSQN